MAYRLLALITVALTPLVAGAVNSAVVMEMHPYVEGREFPWFVPLIGALCVVSYLRFRFLANGELDKLRAR